MRKKTFYGFIALILTAVIVITCGVGSSWFTNGNIKTWFNSWGAGYKQVLPDEGENKGDEGNAGNVIVTPNYDNELMSLSVEPFSDYINKGDAISKTFTIKAEVMPEESEATDFTWAIEFENPSSEWASGKEVSDYVYFLSCSNDNRTANFVCRAAFGEPIIVTCSYDLNKSISASCTLDYVSSVSEGIVYTCDKNGAHYNASIVESCTYLSVEDIEYGIGTVKVEIEYDYAWTEIAYELISFMRRNSFYQSWCNQMNGDMDLQQFGRQFHFLSNTETEDDWFSFELSNHVDGSGEYFDYSSAGSNNQYLRAAFTEAARADHDEADFFDGHFYIRVSYNYYYQGQKISGGVFGSTLRYFDFWDFGSTLLSVDNVNVDKDHIILY